VISLTAAWAEHKAAVVTDRDDGTSLHSSDLHACDYALHQRLHGAPQLPNDDGSFANFERGLAFEARMADWLPQYVAKHHPGLRVTHGEKVVYDGIECNLDFVLYDAPSLGEKMGQHGPTPLAVIDLSTTAGKSADWSYGHALKSAFYATAKGCDTFAEFVVRVGFGGLILDVAEHWFKLDDVAFEHATWRDLVQAASRNVHLIAAAHVYRGEPEPPYNPKDRELETWRCAKYCRAATCYRNGRLSAADREALEVLL
jgi:hypothetical protein